MADPTTTAETQSVAGEPGAHEPSPGTPTQERMAPEPAGDEQAAAGAGLSAPAATDGDSSTGRHDITAPAGPRGGQTPEARGPMRHAALIYSLLRLVLLVAVLGVLWLVGMRGLLWLAFGLLISGIISIFTLSRQRDAMSGSVSKFFGRINDRIEASKRAEDVNDDEAPADL